jgi:hypothetical protein
LLSVAAILFALAFIFLLAYRWTPPDLRSPQAFRWGASSSLQLVAQAAAAAFVLVFLVPPAFAADAVAGYSVDLSPLVTTVISFAIAALTAGLGWAAQRLLAAVHLSNDARVRQFLDEVMKLALSWAQEHAARAGSNLSHVQVRQQLVADALNYVKTSAPDALQRFGITPDRLQQMLEARLGVVVADPPANPNAGAPAPAA